MSSEERNDSVDRDAVWTAVARGLAGEQTPAERDALRRELDAHPERAALVDALDRAVRPASADAAAGIDVEAALAKVMARRDAEEAPAERPRPVHRPASPSPVLRPRRWHASPLLRAAAAVLVLLTAVVVWKAMRGGSSPDARYATAVGARETVTLPDGSTVRLGPDSRLEVAAGYGEGAREVTLRGEGFFRVEHDAARPFVVRTPDAVVRDLGTAFTVRTTGGIGSGVAVTEGSVSLAASEAGEAQVLRAGDRGRVDAAGRVTVERGTATEEDVAWTRGRLVFRDAPVAEVADALRRWYGVTLVVDPALADRHLTAAFEGGTAADALRVVAAALGGELRLRGDTAVVGAAVP